jgi:hypothetical protein
MTAATPSCSATQSSQVISPPTTTVNGAHFNQAIVALWKGDVSGMKTSFACAFGSPEAAQDYVSGTLSELTFLWEQEATAALKKREFSVVISLCERILEINPSDKLVSSQMTNAMLEQGIEAARKGDWEQEKQSMDKAALAYAKYSSHDSTHQNLVLTVWMTLVDSHSKKKEYEQVQFYCAKILAIPLPNTAPILKIWKACQVFRQAQVQKTINTIAASLVEQKQD